MQFTARTGTGACPADCTTVSTPTTHLPVPDDPTTGTTIAAGPYQGFKGLVTHYNIMVTAKSSGGSEIRMRRELQTVAVPVFQFGLFSESSLSFHAGADFNFGGRIHTNGDLFLTSGDGTTLTLSDKVTAVGEIVRKYLDSGILATNWEGTVKMAKGTSTYRNLAATEGSVTGGLSPTPSPAPTPPATCAVSSCINDPALDQPVDWGLQRLHPQRPDRAKRLDLPLVAYGAAARRPDPAPAASRVAACSGSPTPRRSSTPSATTARRRCASCSPTRPRTSRACPTSRGRPISLEAAASLRAEPAQQKRPSGDVAGHGHGHLPVDRRTSLIGGFIKADIQKTDGTWIDATPALLALGIAGRNLSNGTVNTASNSSCSSAVNPHPNAVIRLQRVKDVPTAGGAANNFHCGSKASGDVSQASTDYWPLALYDAREGVKRDEAPTTETADNDKRRAISIGGVMYYVELDTFNLAKWFKNTASGFTDGIGSQAKSDNNGYIVYFSDRRNNRNAANKETAEYGNEDIVNPTSQAGTANGALDPGEDVNAIVPVAPATYTARARHLRHGAQQGPGHGEYAANRRGRPRWTAASASTP